ncbi:MAG: TlyA family RNA methyltransferase [Bacteriovorax sp.]|nr:TlyA family RNA methyltransferase [Rhizobacter sp.]
MRADQLIMQRGLAPTRSAAQRLIAQAAVRWLGPNGWAVPRKAGEELPEDCQLEVTDDAELRFVSRGGLKLAGALDHCGIEVARSLCLDVGQSTGGFTDVLLQRGARKVVGVDVGHGQLHARLRADARVVALEGVNARHMKGTDLPHRRYDLVVGDLSFISLTLVLPALAQLVKGELLMLVKPQFELQPADIGSGGVVKDPASYVRVEQRLREACAAVNLNVTDWFASPISGGDGNREFFIRAAPAAAAGPAPATTAAPARKRAARKTTSP